MKENNLIECLRGADGLALFSGGLDSILAARLVQDQGLDIRCLHFVSPFFGFPERVEHWQELYGLKIFPVDIGEAFVRMLKNPPHGVGSVINPCVDCKILMLGEARRLMLACGAKMLITGEVLGQRPMSQRRDTLNIIRRDADVKPWLLRPLCAKTLEPSEPELNGLVDREKLMGISGRGRKQQLELAARYGFTELPTPGGGCLLTEKENARSYWPMLAFSPSPSNNDFQLAGTGRQYWQKPNGQKPGEGQGAACLLAIGRNQADNDALQILACPGDLVLKTKDFPGPVAIARNFGQAWQDALVASAAAFMASFSPKAVRSGGEVAVRAHLVAEKVDRPVEAGEGAQAAPQALDSPPWQGERLDGRGIMVLPERGAAPGWQEYTWDEVVEDIRARLRK